MPSICRVREAAARARAVAAMALAALCLLPASAPGFGQNKVQYERFHWSYYQTEHFDVYFTQGGEPIARFAAEHIEEMYEKVATMVGHRLTERVPVILHNTHAQFQQTNVIPIPLHEGIGGFTERFKNRVVLPFEGSYRNFYQVLQHELVHAVVFNMLFGGPGMPTSRQYGGFPLWVNEGLAEYVALGWDLGSEFFMIDATTFGYVAPPIANFGGFLAYKGGQLFFHFLETVYGTGTTTRFIRNLAESGDVQKAFRKTTNTSLEEAGEIWLRELRHLYWPELGQREYGKSVARKLTNHGRDRSFYNLQPSLSPNGEEIAFFSDRESWEAIYILNVKTEKVTRAVIQGGRRSEHESFHAFKSGITWSPDSRSLAVVSQQQGRDVIHILDARRGKVRRVLRPPVEAIQSPTWSRDGKRIAFSGHQGGFADIYVYELETNVTRRLTSDMAHDDKPVFSPSGRWIAFESDRPGPDRGTVPYDSLLPFKDIYRISVDGGALELVAGGPWDEKMPSYGPSDSSLMFVSNRSGLDNIYLWTDSARTVTERPVTNLLTGCFTPSWSWDGKQLAFSLFEAGGWDIYLMRDPLDKVKPDPLPRTRFIRSQEDSGAGFFRPPAWENLSSFRADSAAAATGRSTQERIAATQAGTAGDSLIPAAEYLAERADSLRADSLRADTTRVPPPPSSVGPPPDTPSAVRIENFQHSRAGQRRPPSSFLRDSAAYRTDTGFIRREYTPKWSFDGATAAVGVDNQYGTGGLAYVTLSDLMGDQQVNLALSINGSLQNASGYVEYAYLPHRTDYVALAFRDAQEWSYSTYWGAERASYSSEAAGAGFSARYPFSTFTRVEGGVFARYAELRSRIVDYDTLGQPDTVRSAVDRVNAFLPSAAWVHDNAQWGIVGPVAGRRMMAVLQYLPPLFQDEHSYVKADADFRHYWEFFKRYTFAARVSAGLSQALGGYENPHSYGVGGESFTFNARANNENLPATLTEVYFSDLDFPLRGYDFYEFRGNRKFLGNLEFRFPFITQLSVAWPLPFSIRHVMGNLFLDFGGAWSEGNPFRQEVPAGAEASPGGIGVGYGYGARLNLGVFVLKYTRAWSVKEMAGRDLGPRSYWSLGSEF